MRRGENIPILPSANLEGVTENVLADILSRYRQRIKYLDLDVGAETYERH
ncbi:MAG TPA: hypothetical protein VNO70_24075 [Blastocatellia bacterium]|nr:hypothetical protein [Blastocatellia bacterium]